ncbi:type II toxin-antitoxin system RelE/ParE family toxin [Saccharopolyspora cebuensis]|uniref:Type II toxin-antitoxin system RelE/ParE family toxin n=1 Tax=Saccharopolyspora cebuensis TaxID=418759 RepID=A0ABV4CM12_9PSEU
MPYSVEILREAGKFLDKLAHKQPKTAAALENAIEELAADPRRRGSLPLTGCPGVLRYRVGNYRICYEIDDGRVVVLVITISTRADVYQVLRRTLGR